MLYINIRTVGALEGSTFLSSSFSSPFTLFFIFLSMSPLDNASENEWNKNNKLEWIGTRRLDQPFTPKLVRLITLVRIYVTYSNNQIQGMEITNRYLFNYPILFYFWTKFSKLTVSSVNTKPIIYETYVYFPR